MNFPVDIIKMKRFLFVYALNAFEKIKLSI